MSASFVAKYDGKCTECQEPIAAGDDAGFADGEIVCDDCHMLFGDDLDEWEGFDEW